MSAFALVFALGCNDNSAPGGSAGSTGSAGSAGSAGSVELLTAGDLVPPLAVDDEHVYFASPATPGNADLQRMPKAGGVRETILPNSVVGEVAAHGEFLYMGSEKGLLRRDGATGDVTTLDEDRADKVRIDPSGYVYWTALDPVDYTESIRRQPLDGGDVEHLVSGEAVVFDFAVDATHVYWAGSTAIWRSSIAGGPREDFAAENASRIRIAQGYVYWIGASSGDYVLRRRSDERGPIEELVPGNVVADTLLADDGFVYMGRADEIVRVDVATRSVEVFAAMEYGPDALTADSEHLFVISAGLHRIPKAP